MGHAHHGQQGQLLPLSAGEYGRAGLADPARLLQDRRSDSRQLRRLTGALASSPPRVELLAQSVRDRIRLEPDKLTADHRVAGQRADADADTKRAVRPIQIWVRTAGTIDDAGEDRHRRLSPARRRARQGRAAGSRVSARVALVDVPGAESRSVATRGGGRW